MPVARIVTVTVTVTVLVAVAVAVAVTVLVAVAVTVALAGWTKAKAPVALRPATPASASGQSRERVAIEKPQVGPPTYGSDGARIRFFALILGGGKEAEDAASVVAAFKAGGATPIAGYPTIVKSDDVRGMNPGFYVAVLGYCGDDVDLGSEVRAMWRAQRGSYAREIDGTVAGACPTLRAPLPPTAEERRLLDKARAIEEHDAWQRAVDAYDELIQLNPGNKDAVNAAQRLTLLHGD